MQPLNDAASPRSNANEYTSASKSGESRCLAVTGFILIFISSCLIVAGTAVTAIAYDQPQCKGLYYPERCYRIFDPQKVLGPVLMSLGGLILIIAVIILCLRRSRIRLHLYNHYLETAAPPMIQHQQHVVQAPQPTYPIYYPYQPQSQPTVYSYPMQSVPTTPGFFFGNPGAYHAASAGNTSPQSRHKLTSNVDS